jgi:hypothetical protein
MSRPPALARWSRALLLVASIDAPCLVSWTSAASAAAPEIPEVGPVSFVERVARAEAHRAAGEHAEAARAFVVVYDALAEDEQGGLKGELMVSNAVDDFRLAQEAAPQSLALLEEEAALLERHAQRGDGLPAELVNELQRVEARIDALRRAQVIEAEPPPTATEAEAQPPAEMRPMEAMEAVDEPHGADEPAPVVPRSRRSADVVVLGSGVVGIVAGASLLVAGVWTFGAANERRDRQLAALNANEYPDEAGIRDRLDQWHARGRGIATGLTIGGALLAGVGLGLTSWGLVRRTMEQRPRERGAARVTPMVSRDRLGIAATVAF